MLVYIVLCIRKYRCVEQRGIQTNQIDVSRQAAAFIRPTAAAAHAFVLSSQHQHIVASNRMPPVILYIFVNFYTDTVINWNLFVWADFFRGALVYAIRGALLSAASRAYALWGIVSRLSKNTHAFGTHHAIYYSIDYYIYISFQRYRNTPQAYKCIYTYIEHCRANARTQQWQRQRRKQTFINTHQANCFTKWVGLSEQQRRPCSVSIACTQICFTLCSVMRFIVHTLFFFFLSSYTSSLLRPFPQESSTREKSAIMMTVVATPAAAQNTFRVNVVVNMRR